MSKMAMPGALRSPAFIWVRHLLRALDRVPCALLALPLRVAIATVFWNSGMIKLANGDTTIALFVDEYQVPLLPPEVAASMAATIELTTPALLVLGLLTRAASIVLLGTTTVI
jgi:putative oxidoreductase